MSRTRKGGERPDRSLSPDSPSMGTADEENKLYQLVHWRLLTKNLSNLRALVEQLGYPLTDLYRRIYDRGDLMESALHSPDPTTGLFGTYLGERLAQRLINDINALIEFVMGHGQVPTVIRLQQERIAELEAIQALLRSEIRPLALGDLRVMLREELGAFLQPGTSAPAARTAPGTANTMLTEVAPEGQATIDALFDQ